MQEQEWNDERSFHDECNNSTQSVSFAEHHHYSERYPNIENDPNYIHSGSQHKNRYHRSASRRSMSIKHSQVSELDESTIMAPLKKENKVKMQTRRLFLRRNKGVWSRHHHLEYIMYVLFPLTIQITCGWSWAFPDGAHPACDSNGMGGSSTKNTKICNLGLWLGDALLQFQVLVAFVLAGFVMSSVRLFRMRRTNYARLCGAVRNILINISSLVPLSDNNVEINQARINMLRWVILAYELSVLKGRGCIDNESGREYLENLNLLKRGEWDSLIDGDRHTTAWWWIQMQARELRRRGVIVSDIDFHKICNAVTLCRGEANDLMSVIDRDQPPPYSSVCSLLVNVNIFIFLFQKGVLWATWAFELGWGGIYAEPKMYLSIFVVYTYCAIFSRLFDLCYALHNPFGPRKFVDLPHGPISAGLRKLAKELCECHLPPTFLDPKSTNTSHLRRASDYGIMDSTRGFATHRSSVSSSAATASASTASNKLMITYPAAVPEEEQHHADYQRNFQRRSDYDSYDSSTTPSRSNSTFYPAADSLPSTATTSLDSHTSTDAVNKPYSDIATGAASAIENPSIIPEEETDLEDPSMHYDSIPPKQPLSFSVKDIDMFQQPDSTSKEKSLTLSLNGIATYLGNSASKLLSIEEGKKDDIGFIQLVEEGKKDDDIGFIQV